METLLGLIDIIDKMHKHSIEDYKNEISCVFDEDIISDHKFEKVYTKQFHLMFDHIEEEFIHRLINLKCKLMKRLDIKPRIINKLNVIQEENECDNESDNKSDNESENECDNESDNKSDNESENELESDLPNKPNKPYIEDLKTLSKLKPGDTFNGIKYMGPYNPTPDKKYINEEINGCK